ncbi:MAG: glycosyltransferase family 1 protein [bacterium]|nr:glycosyltransferase family 1 protein [bacterium]
MVTHRLLEALAHYDPKEAERVFGDECAINPPDPAVALAPVKRVALFAEAFLPKVDGVSKTAYLTLRYLEQTGREVVVFAPDIAPHSVSQSDVVPLPSLGFRVAPETRMALPHPLVVQRLNDFKPDLIHLFSPAFLSVSGMLYGRQNGIPVVANYQTDLPNYALAYGYPFLSDLVRDWLRYIHNGSHLTLVPTTYTMRKLRGEGYHRLRKWGRGVNNRRFNPARRSEAMRARLLNGRDPNSLLCIYVGRLANEKRVDLLLEAARTPGVALTIIGDGMMRAELEAMFAGTNTHFTGYLLGDDLGDAYASADVFMFTGAYETFGQVVQEGLASGLPAVIINQGGITDLIKDGWNGFHCPPDPEAFAAAARQLRDDPALRQRMAQNALSVAENRWEYVLQQLETHYAEAIDINQRYQQLFPPLGTRFQQFFARFSQVRKTDVHFTQNGRVDRPR